jgi:DNA-binding IscR family transcriptional regulator
MGDVLRAIHGEVFETPALGDNECPVELKKAWKQVQKATRDAADSVDFQKLVEESASRDKMYYI